MYDVVILGAGPGGYETAYLAGKAGLKVAVIEESQVGGVCLNRGCIPLKSYLYVSKVKNAAEYLQRNGMLEGGNSLKINQSGVTSNKNKIVQVLRSSVSGKMIHANVDFYQGRGIIRNVEDFIEIKMEKEIVKGSKLVIATGSCAKEVLLPEKQLNYKIINSDQMLELETIPQSVLIVGGGVIGLEAASYFRDSGSKVVIVDKLNTICSEFDHDISEAMQKNCEKKGIKIHTKTSIKEFKIDGVICESNDQEFELYTECILVAIGREANLDGWGLEVANLAVNQRGIIVNDYCQTSNSNIYACGDVTGEMMLAHVAYRQAKVIVEHLIGNKSILNYNLVPSIIYSNPEVASVGLTEKVCKERGLNYIAKSISMAYSGRYFVENGKDGAMAKMIVHEETKELLGFSMIGNYASEIILAFEIMLYNHMTADEMRNLIYPHPTVAEITHELLELF